MSVVAAVTTHEPRSPYIRPSVESILAQEGVDRVVLLVGNALVERVVKQVLSGLSLDIVQVEDIGPGKKHLAPCDPDDTIVTFDDDKVYDPSHAQALVQEMERSGLATGALGFLATLPLKTVRSGPCDLLHGEVGIAYRASWLDPDEVLDFGRRPECRHNDDVYVGWLLKKRGGCNVLAAEEKILRPKSNVPAARASAINGSPARRWRLRQCMEATFLGMR